MSERAFSFSGGSPSFRDSVGRRSFDIDMSEVLLMFRKKRSLLEKKILIKQLQDDGVEMFQAQYRDCPVDTGYLRSTGRWRSLSNGFEIVWGDPVAYYWRYVEYGTSMMRPKAFIMPNFYRYQQQIWNNFRATWAKGKL